jgi:tetratricopeptide (TPR) repeat protein
MSPPAFRRVAPALWAAVLTLALLPLPAAADRGSSVPTPPPAPTRTPEQEAAFHHNKGLSLRDKAWKLEEKAAQAPEGERAKLLANAQKAYHQAVGEFRAATSKAPKLHQAWSGLGYALRKTGEYTESLAAYDRALTLAPNYLEAIEYRGEAYLGLGRLEDAKSAFDKLAGADPEMAGKLLAAMKEWAEAHKARPGGMDPAEVERFAGWVAERQSQSSSAGAHGGAGW